MTYIDTMNSLSGIKKTALRQEYEYCFGRLQSARLLGTDSTEYQKALNAMKQFYTKYNIDYDDPTAQYGMSSDLAEQTGLTQEKVNTAKGLNADGTTEAEYSNNAQYDAQLKAALKKLNASDYDTYEDYLNAVKDQLKSDYYTVNKDDYDEAAHPGITYRQAQSERDNLYDQMLSQIDFNDNFQKTYYDDARAKAAAQAATKEADTATETANKESMNEIANTATQAATAAATAGLNQSKVGMLSDTAASSTSQNNNNASYRNSAVSSQKSTQADYLKAMGQADNLQNQANNASEGVGWATASGALNGAGTVGSFLYSDERMKEEDELFTAVKKFKELYEQLQEIKG